MKPRTFGRDPGSDRHGRHALIYPGGDNQQRDVLRLIDLGALYADGWRLHPQQFDESYVGRHRADDYDAVGAWRETADIEYERRNRL